jgi:hypothetical protein
MKKIMLSLLLLAGIGLTTKAQTPVYNTSNSTPVYTTTTDPVYVAPTTVVVVPEYTERMFRMNYPNVNRSTWYRVDDDWYRVTYWDNGPWYTLGYNTTRGESYPIALPVTENAVPSSVVDAVLNRFSSIYDITETVGSDMQTQYMVRTIESDGQAKSWRVNASGMDVSQ